MSQISRIGIFNIFGDAEELYLFSRNHQQHFQEFIEEYFNYSEGPPKNRVSSPAYRLDVQELLQTVVKSVEIMSKGERSIRQEYKTRLLKLLENEKESHSQLLTCLLHIEIGVMHKQKGDHVAAKLAIDAGLQGLVSLGSVEQTLLG